MSISEKTNNKIDQSNTQYNLDQKTVKVSALSLGNVGKYKFLSEKYVSSVKDLLQKSAVLKKFEYYTII